MRALLRGTSVCAILVGSICPAAGKSIDDVFDETTSVPKSSEPASSAAPASPQASSAEPATDDIVVTAQRRSESVQRVPLAVTALSGDNLKTRGVVDLSSLSATVPGLNIGEQVGQARLTLRGIGVDNVSTGAESSVAFNQDNVFYSRSAAALASFYDVDRVEVLRGPQGTLYGRNATGGSVNILTNRPSQQFGGGVSLTVGNYDTIIAEGFANTPLSDTIASRISFQVQHRGGYGKNLVTGGDIDNRQSQALRGQLLFEPSGRLSILVAGDYFHEEDASNGYHYFGPGGLTVTGAPVTPSALLAGGYAASNIRDVALGSDPTNNTQFWGGRVDIHYELSNIVTLRSLSAYRGSDFVVTTDASPFSIPIFPLRETEKSNQYSQEFQVNVDTSDNKLVLGIFYLHEDIDGVINAPLNLVAVGGPSFFVQGFYAGGSLKTDAAAAFAQDTYSITPHFRATLGGRYSWEKKRVADQTDFDFARPFDPDNLPLSPVHRDSKVFKSFTPKVGLEYDLASQTLVYVSFSKGFKAGTYNLGSAGPALKPEKVDAYEAGIKSTFLDGKLRANIAGFYYDYTDLQVGKIQQQILALENAATARIYGIEGEFTARPVEGLTLSVNASWLHARFQNYVTGDPARPGGDGVTLDPDTGAPAFDLHGKTLPQAPNYTVDAGIEYRFPAFGGHLSLRGESSWSARVWFSPFNRPEMSQPAFNTQDAFLNYEPDGARWRLSFYARNLANVTIKSSAQISSTAWGSPVVGFVKPPRTFGGTFSIKY